MKRLAASIPLLALLALLALAAGLFVACGGGGSDDAGESAGTPGAGQATDASGQPSGVAGPDSPTLTAGSATAATGAEASVDVEVLGFGPPGLGAWTVDIAYDSDIVSIADCATDTANASNVCNPEYSDATIRIAGAVAEGLEGDTVIGRLTFTCKAAGTSALELSISVLADGTLGDPRPTAANVGDGTITCT